MPPFEWLKQFQYAISLATDLERLLEPPLTGNKIRSIYSQSFPPHYRIALVEAGTYPHNTNHMDDIMAMTTAFADIYDRELTQPAPPIPPSGAFPLNIPIDAPLLPYPRSNTIPKRLDPSGIDLLQAGNLPDFDTFQPTLTDFRTDVTLQLHLQWADLPPFSKPPAATLYHHVAKYLMYEMDLLHREDDLLHRWTHSTLGLDDHHRLCILHWTIRQWLPPPPTPNDPLASTSPAGRN